MPIISNATPKTFSELMETVEEFQESRKISWYRGVSDATHQLLPSIFRHPKTKSIEKIHEIERSLSLAFEQRSPPFVSQSFENVWQKMFFMQHYGIPTRLLDWSESPFVGLYFALANCERDKNGKPKYDAALWMLDPEAWNQGALRDISYDGGVLDPTREQLKSYSPNAELDERKNLPVMIYGTHNSPRIVAQRGMFALFGKSTYPMEKAFEENAFSDGSLRKVVISKEFRDKIASSLFRKGVSDSTIYPDLVGLSLELRRSFGFTK